MKNKSVIQSVWDFLGIPFRLVLCDQKWLPALGWTTLERERLDAVLPHVQGNLLDIGAGPNTLVNEYGHGTGVDVFDWGGGVVVIEDSAKLPFPDQMFDTVTFVASLNHIPNREQALAEARRVMSPGGRLIITMIGPVLGGVGHAVWWYSEDKKRGGMKPGETGGISTRRLVRMCRNAGFRLIRHERFVYGMNNLYLFVPDSAANNQQDTE